ncbi:MAG: 50S ribosomal protein L4 [Acidimicrobiales bacterium]
MSAVALAGSRSRAEKLLEPVTINRTTDAGVVLGVVSLDREFFSVAANVPLVHQVVTAQLAARRAGTQSTKTRSEVRGGSAKPYRQKGTGNARQGSIRAPHYAGGGVALGPKPRDYWQRTPRKMVQQAFRCALSDRARSGALRLVDHWTMEVPRTKEALKSLAALDCSGRVLVVVTRDDDAVERSFRNVPGVQTMSGDQVTAHDLLAADVVVFTDETLPGSTSTGPPPSAKLASAAKVAPKKAPATAPAHERSATEERGEQ